MSAALAIALATGVVLCALAALAVAELPPPARAGHWSADSLADVASVPIAIGLPLGIVAAGLVVCAVVRAFGDGLRALRLSRDVRRLGEGVGGLVLVDDTEPAAFAVPGRMVVTSALVRRLDAGERRAVLAHEASHVRHRHYLFVQLADIAAAANPLLRQVVPAVRLAVERWADEDAAGAVGDRGTVARALAKAGSARPHAAALCMAETEVVTRMRQLVHPQTGRRFAAVGWLVLAVVALAGAGAFAALAHDWFEAAQAAYRR